MAPGTEQKRANRSTKRLTGNAPAMTADSTGKQSALIVGAGSGISAALARQLHAKGMSVGLVARQTGKLRALAAATSAHLFEADAADAEAIAAVFEEADRCLGPLAVVVYNASVRPASHSLLELDPALVARHLATSGLGAFLVIQQAARRMVPKQQGTILLTGATASVRGFPGSAAFAMGKFALRGLAQSAARELGPKGVHVAHLVIDGRVARSEGASDGRTSMAAEHIAATYMHLIAQDATAWTFEADLRPWNERF